MRPDFFSWLTGLSLCLAPVSASANDVEINAYLPPVVAPLGVDGPACPENMVLREVHLDRPADNARYDQNFDKPPSKKVPVRRAIRLSQADTPSLSHPQFHRALDYNARDFRNVNLHLRLNMRLCEGLDTVKLVDGTLAIIGQVGLYDVRYTTAITDDPDDSLHLYWKKKITWRKPAPHALGLVSIKLIDQPFDAQHPQTAKTLKGTFSLLLNTEITSQ